MELYSEIQMGTAIGFTFLGSELTVLATGSLRGTGQKMAGLLPLSGCLSRQGFGEEGHGVICIGGRF